MNANSPALIVFFFSTVLLSANGCKQLNSSELLSQDHLRGYQGAIQVVDNTAQFPNLNYCQNQFVDQKQRDRLVVDLAWQFSDVKEQHYGDCYAFAAVAGVEAAINRSYMRKPQIGLSEQYALLHSFLSPEQFEYLKYRMIMPIIDSGTSSDMGATSFANRTFSGGWFDPIIMHLLQHSNELVLHHEFGYEDLELVMSLIRSEILGQGVPALAFNSLDDMLLRIEKKLLPFADSLPDESALEAGEVAGLIVRSLRFDILNRRLGGEQQAQKLRDLLARRTNLGKRSDEQNRALLMRGAHMRGVMDGISDRADLWQALDALMGIYTKWAATAALPQRFLPDPWGGAPPPQDFRPKDIEDELHLARVKCDTDSKELQRLLENAVCQRIPVVVALPMIGVLVRQEDNRAQLLANQVRSEAADWFDYLHYLFLHYRDGAPAPNENFPHLGPYNYPPPSAPNNSNNGLRLTQHSKDDFPVNFAMYRKISGPSRGDARIGPDVATYLDPYKMLGGDHANHAMVIDGIDVIDGQRYWRFRNSWGGTGSAYIPFTETCRIFAASAILVGGETL